MARVLHLHAHPAPSQSLANRALVRAAQGVSGITSVDLYARYPRFDIDVGVEQAQLSAHDVVVLQFPLFWYSCPALVKEWMDLVLSHGWAYGTQGTALRGKTLLLALTAGSPEQAYQPDGHQGHRLRDFLTPFDQLAVLCQMRALPPLVLFQARHADRAAHAERFAAVLAALRDDRFDPGDGGAQGYLTAQSPEIATLGAAS